MPGLNLGLVGAGMAAGANEGMQQVLARRLLEKKMAEALKQQEFDNRYRTRGQDLQAQQQRDSMAEQARGHDLTAANQFLQRGIQMGEQVPPGTFYEPTDPSAQPLHAVGMLRAQQERAPVDVGPLLPGDTDEARREGFIKTESAGQRNIREDNERARAESGRQERRDAETERYHTGMLNKPTGTGGTGRLDKSYDTQTKRLDAIEKPLAEQAERIGRLRATINQMSPAADALIAPELLTAMAGGQGSGLRMNEAEIARIVGGRTQWESLRSRLEAWSGDPTRPFSVTPEQRKQMRALVLAIAKRGQTRLGLIDDARSKMVDATDVVEHRRIVDATKKALAADAYGEEATQQTGIPEVGGTFNGGKVLKVTPIRD